MRLPNGYGSIYKMSGNRRNPWRVRITVGWAFDEVLMKNKQVVKDLGYFRTRQEAMKALAEYNDNPFDLNYMSITLAECYEEAKKGFTEHRRGNYQAAWKYLEPLHDVPIRSIKAAQMQKCIDACTTSQQQDIKTVCHKIYDYALKYEIVDKNPSKFLRSNTVATQIKREVLSNDDISKLEQVGEWWAKITLMLLYSGMRTKELKQLDPEWIDTDNSVIDIQLAKNRSSLRKIPIHAHVLPLFCDYKAEGGNLYGYTHDGLNKALKAFCGHTAHDCRHTFATQMRLCGCDPLILQLLLGHTPSTITEKIYTHVTIEELAESLNKLKYTG